MKSFILSALAATIAIGPIAVTAAEAAPQRRDTTIERRDNGRTVVTRRTVARQPQYRTWRKGERFDSRQARNYRSIDNYRAYRLSAPPRGYQWRQSGNDAVLVAVASGLIGAVVGGAIR